MDKQKNRQTEKKKRAKWQTDKRTRDRHKAVIKQFIILIPHLFNLKEMSVWVSEGQTGY